MRGLTFAVLILCASLLTGCLGITPMPMAQYTGSKGLPNESSTRTLDSVDADYNIVGPVDATGNSRVILGLVFNQGTEGYGLMMEDARYRYDESTTTILFPMIDYEYEGILYPIWGTMKTKYYGTAVKAENIHQFGADVAAQQPASKSTGGLLGTLFPF